jgi:WD40 repeat protein
MDIQRYLNQEPVGARPPSTAYRVNKFIRRNKLATMSAATISTVLVLGITISTGQAIKARRAEREQSRLRQEAQRAKQEATDKLWTSYLAEARARRSSGVAGVRFESLAALGKAAAIKPSLELRNEAIASMVLTDVRWVKEKDFSRRALVIADGSLARYAVSAPGRTISIRRVSDDTELMSLPSVGAALTGIWSFSPDGKLLGVLYADDRLRIWDCDKSAVFLEAQSIAAAAFSPDSTRLVTLENNDLVLYPLRDNTGTIAPTRHPFGQGQWRLVFHPAGHLLAAYSESKTNLLLLDSNTGKIVRVLSHPDNLVEAAWHPDGRRLATTCSDNLIHIWDTSTGQNFQSLPADQVVSVGFNHRGNLLVSAGWDGKTRLWDFANSRQLVSIYRAGFIRYFSSDDQQMVCSHWDATGLDLFEVANGEGLRTIHQREKGPDGLSSTAVFSATGRLLAYSMSTGTRLWDVAAGREVGAVDGEDFTPIGFDSEDRNVILAGTHGLFRWPIKESPAEGVSTGDATIQPQVRLPGRYGRISADGKTCVLVGGDRCEIYKTDSFGEPVRTGVQPGMRFAALTSDGSLVASGAWHSSGVVVWDGKTGQPVKELPTDDEEASNVIFSPDGRRLVVSTKRDYWFLEVGSWSTVLRIPQQAGNDFAAMMAFSSDGTLFAGTHSRSIVRLFEAATGKVLADLESPDSKMVTRISFNADGTELAMCEGLSVVRIWDLRLIRERLAPMGLDWKAPPYPRRDERSEASSAPRTPPPVIRVPAGAPRP